MRCISAITALIADAPATRLSLQSSTQIAVPMMASSRFIQPPAEADATNPGATPLARWLTLVLPNMDVAIPSKMNGRL